MVATASLAAGLHLTYTQLLSLSKLNNNPEISETFQLCEHGLKLHIKPDTLPKKNVSRSTDCSITISVTGNTLECFQFDSSVMPISPVYYINSSLKFNKPVALEIDHCCSPRNEKDSKGLVAMIAHTSNQTPPYKFEYLEEGKFTINRSRGTVSVDSFALYTIAYDFLKGQINAPIMYTAYIYCCNADKMMYKVHIALCRKLNHCKVCVLTKHQYMIVGTCILWLLIKCFFVCTECY